MGRLLTYMRPYRKVVAVSLVLLFFNSLFQIVGPLLTKLAIDRYLVPTGKPFWPPLDARLAADPWTGLAQISFIYLLAIIGGLLCDFGETYLMQWTGQKAMFDLRRQLMATPADRSISRSTTTIPSAAWSRASPPMSMS